MQDNISPNNQQVVEVDQEGIDAALGLETITLRLEEELVEQLLSMTPSRNLDSLHALIRQALKEFIRNESNKAHVKVAVGGEEWIEWHGGECPFVVGTRAEFVLRNGDIGYSITSSNLCWKHEGVPSDIVAYRPLEEGWVKWEGGICPVTIGTQVDVIHADGGVYYSQKAGEVGVYAESWAFDGHPSDIIAYRVVTDADWTPWEGGECPLPEDTVVSVKFSCGKISSVNTYASTWCWSHEDSHDFSIVGYRLAGKIMPSKFKQILK